MKPIIQIEKTLPRKAWENLKINDSGQKMVPVHTTDRLFHSDIKKDAKSFYLREGAYKVLLQATTHLPLGYTIVFIQGYRGLKEQQANWDSRYAELESKHKDWDKEKLEYETSLVTARPKPLANHNCGGAMDVMLEKDGELVDMGTPYINEGSVDKYKRLFPMFAEGITAEQAANRSILRDAMVKAGCVYYPEEWWHYCWGDRMWAVYTGRSVYYYGPVNPEEVQG